MFFDSLSLLYYILLLLKSTLQDFLVLTEEKLVEAGEELSTDDGDSIKARARDFVGNKLLGEGKYFDKK